MTVNTSPDIHEQVICANCFIRKDDKYLVLRRSAAKKYAPGVVHPVGGKVNLGENPYTAVIREVKEETGVEVTNLKLRAVILEIEPVAGEPYNWLIFHFLGDYKQGEVKTTEEGELIWLKADELAKESLFPSVKRLIAHILNIEIGTAFATFKYDGQKQKIIKESLNLAS